MLDMGTFSSACVEADFCGKARDLMWKSGGATDLRACVCTLNMFKHFAQTAAHWKGFKGKSAMHGAYPAAMETAV